MDGHRRLRGPYTAAGSLVRAIVSRADARVRNIAQRHALTLLSVAPEIGAVVPPSDALARSFTFSREGNSRFYTLRLAHGLTDFVRACLEGPGAPPCSIVFENMHAADSLDREFVTVLLRRVDPRTVRITVGSAAADLDEPRVAGERDRGADTLPPAELRALAARYVDSDGTADVPDWVSAYHRCPDEVRRELHLARLARLEAANEPTLGLGAIPFHHECSTRAVEPLQRASVYCMRMGYYEASLDLALRGTALTSEAERPGRRGSPYVELGRNTVFSLLLLDRLEEVERYCERVRATADDPALLSHCAYAMAILFARAYPEERRDYGRARYWVEVALAAAERVPPSEEKVVNLVFLRNTLALVEMREGRPEVAHELLTRGLARLEREAPGKIGRESIILLNNRAKVHVRLGRIDRALEDYTTLLAREPSNSEAHLDRGILYQRLGRHGDALADYDEAIAWSPPYEAVHFNRAQMLAVLGRKDDAIAAYDYVLSLEPEHRDALVNRAGLRFERGDREGAREDVERVLRVAAGDAKALCLRGLLEMAEGRLAGARASFDGALANDPTEATALVNRATVCIGLGDPDAALKDLDRALALREDVTALCNRARIHQRQRRWSEAIADYSRALALSPDGAGDAARQRTLCERVLAAESGG